jgi:hypothetical protein
MELDFVLVSGTQARNARVNLRVKNLSGTEHFTSFMTFFTFCFKALEQENGFQSFNLCVVV